MRLMASSGERRRAQCGGFILNGEWLASTGNNASAVPHRRMGLENCDDTGGGVRGRVRLHSISAAPGLEVDDERRKALADKGWARRSVVVHGVGPAGASHLEAVPEIKGRDCLDCLDLHLANIPRHSQRGSRGLGP